MTTRKTLALNPEAAASTEAPALKKKGRGWEISDKRLDVRHEQARELRRHSSEAHKALAEKFAKADMGRYTFKRFAVVGSAIVDFNCHNLGMAIMIDEEGADEKALEEKPVEAVQAASMVTNTVKRRGLPNIISRRVPTSPHRVTRCVPRRDTSRPNDGEEVDGIHNLQDRSKGRICQWSACPWTTTLRPRCRKQ